MTEKVAAPNRAGLFCLVLAATFPVMAEGPARTDILHFDLRTVQDKIFVLGDKTGQKQLISEKADNNMV
jgi:hypothetical protein